MSIVSILYCIPIALKLQAYFQLLNLIILCRTCYTERQGNSANSAGVDIVLIQNRTKMQVQTLIAYGEDSSKFLMGIFRTSIEIP